MGGIACPDVICIDYSLGCPLSQDSCGKWRFRLGSPAKNVIILVVTVTGRGDNRNYSIIVWTLAATAKKGAPTSHVAKTAPRKHHDVDVIKPRKCCKQKTIVDTIPAHLYFYVYKHVFIHHKFSCTKVINKKIIIQTNTQAHIHVRNSKSPNSITVLLHDLANSVNPETIVNI